MSRSENETGKLVFLVSYRRHIICALFLMCLSFDYLTYNLLLNIVRIHPIHDLHLFVTVIFFSIIISWKIRDLKNERESIYLTISLHAPRVLRYNDKQIIIPQKTRMLLENLEMMKRHTSNADAENSKEDYLSQEKVESAEIGNMVNECIHDLHLKYTVESFLFFFNLMIGGYIALCVSTAIIEK